jgi:hypothetical protein
MGEYVLLKYMVQIYFWLVFNQQNLLTLGHMAPLGLLKKTAKLISMSIKI